MSCCFVLILFNRPLIFYAFDFNDNELLKLMLDNGANPNVLHSSGFTPLSLSVYKNDYAKALMLVKAGANPLTEDHEHKNSFYYAHKSGAMFELLCTLTDYFINLIHEKRFGEALSMLDKGIIPHNFTDPRNSKADLISMAFSTNDPDFVGEILLRVHDPSTASFSNTNGDVLYKMCRAKNIVGVRASLKRMGGPEGAKDCWDGNPPIAWSLKHGERYLTGILIDVGFDPNHPYIGPDGEHEHSLNMAVKAADLDLVKKLIDAGVDTNTFDEQFSPALMAMHYELGDILHEIRTNANSNYIPFLYNPKTYELNKTLKKDMENYSLNKKMFELAESGDFDGAIACLDIENNGVHPLSVNSMNAANRTETLLSVFLGKQRNFDAAERLIKLGAIVSNAYIVENDVSKPLFYYACERKDVELMKFLLPHKVNINEPCSNGYNVLTLAIENNYIGLARWLSRTKHAADLLHSEIKPHIHLACELGNVSIVRILVEEFHANVDERVNFGFTPLHIAAKNGFLSIASYLLRHGADPMLKSIDDDEIKNNGTPLDIARFYGNFNVARLILDPREDTLGGLSSSSSSLSLSDSIGGSNLFQELPGEPFEGECSICLEETELVPLSCCGHAFCRDCLNDWFTVQFDGFTRLRCPWNGCNGVCSWYDIIYNVKDKARFEDFYLKKALRGMDDFRWCPKCDSGGFLKCKEGICLKCGYAFCTECMGEYHSGNCAELYINNNNEFWSNKWIKGNTKACPKCKVLVFKDGGCSHLKCTRCEYEFCWLCLREYTGRYTFDDIDPCDNDDF